MQIVRRRPRVAVPPERIHQLFAMKSMVGRKREQLHELARFLQPPPVVRHLLAADGGGEAAEQRDRDLSHATQNDRRERPVPTRLWTAASSSGTM
jgi:hypothetical protein